MHVGYNSTKEKEKLQNVMTYGSEAAPTPVVARPQQTDPEEETEVDRFEEVVQEIEERREFLKEMEALGQGKNYRTKVMTEISQVSSVHIINIITVLYIQASTLVHACYHSRALSLHNFMSCA